MGANGFGLCVALTFLFAPGITALRLKENSAKELTKPTCSQVMKDLEDLEAGVPKIAEKVKCKHVFAGGASAPWAAKFQLKEDYGSKSSYKKGDFIVIKKCDLKAPEVNGATGEEQYNSEAGALRDLSATKSSKRFPGFVDARKSAKKTFGYIAMQFVEGSTCCAGMFEQLQEAPANREIIDSFINALTTMWNAGWAHADHNGDNAIVYEKKGKHHLKLMDFGLAANERDSEKFMEKMRIDAWVAWFWAKQAHLIPKDTDLDEHYPYEEEPLPRTVKKAKEKASESMAKLTKMMNAQAKALAAQSS